MKLIISKPYIENCVNSNKTRLTSVIKTEGGLKNDYPMWLEVDSKYKEFLTDEAVDSQVVCLMLYAMEKNMDIVCEAPISERLYYQLTEYLIPAISKNIPSYKNIKIIAEKKVNLNFGGKYAATGLSCGVDSFYTILKNQNHSEESGLNVKYLTYFNAGASGMYGGNRARRIFQQRAAEFKKVADQLNCEFLIVDSNMNEFLHQNHEATHVFRTLSIPLALQKLFKVYYFSSTSEYALFGFKKFDPSFYDLLTMPNLSTDNIRFVLVGGETTRQGKVNFISSFPVVQKNLNVCVWKAKNCNVCIKCMRTMLNLYLADRLEDFRDCFNVDMFNKNKKMYFLWAKANRKKIDMPEIVQLLKEKRRKVKK